MTDERHDPNQELMGQGITKLYRAVYRRFAFYRHNCPYRYQH